MTNTVELKENLKNWNRKLHNQCRLYIDRKIFNFWIVFTNNRKYCLFSCHYYEDYIVVFCFTVSMNQLFAIEYVSLNHFLLFNKYFVVIPKLIYYIRLCMYLTNVSNRDLVSKTGTHINTVLITVIQNKRCLTKDISRNWII